jgi:hypothetical protein
MDDDIDIVRTVEREGDRSNVALSNFQLGDHCVHRTRAISRRYFSRPRRPRSWWK